MILLSHSNTYLEPIPNKQEYLDINKSQATNLTFYFNILNTTGSLVMLVRWRRLSCKPEKISVVEYKSHLLKELYTSNVYWLSNFFCLKYTGRTMKNETDAVADAFVLFFQTTLE